MTNHVAWIAALLVAGAAAAGEPIRGNQKSGAQPMAKDGKKNEPGSLRVHYLRQKATSCKRVPPNEDGEVCQPVLAPAPKETKVVLKPTGDMAGRKDVTVTFASQAKKQSKDVRVTPGKWTLEWTVAGSKLKERFFVVSGDEFDITLETTEGSCAAKGKGCALAADKKVRSVEIPEERMD